MRLYWEKIYFRLYIKHNTHYNLKWRYSANPIKHVMKARYVFLQPWKCFPATIKFLWGKYWVTLQTVSSSIARIILRHLQNVLKKKHTKVCILQKNTYLCRRFLTIKCFDSSGCSAVRLAHLLWEQGVVGSNPATPTKGIWGVIMVDSSFFIASILLWNILIHQTGRKLSSPSRLKHLDRKFERKCTCTLLLITMQRISSTESIVISQLNKEFSVFLCHYHFILS